MSLCLTDQGRSFYYFVNVLQLAGCANINIVHVFSLYFNVSTSTELLRTNPAVHFLGHFEIHIINIVFQPVVLPAVDDTAITAGKTNEIYQNVV